MLSHTPTVVIIEDDVEIALLIGEILEAAGFRSAHASSGREGLRLVRTLQPDAVVCDACMPEMNGIEVLHELKAHALTARIPVVFMSGYGSGPFRDADADSFVAKPFQVCEMMDAVRGVLRKPADSARRDSADSQRERHGCDQV